MLGAPWSTDVLVLPCKGGGRCLCKVLLSPQKCWCGLAKRECGTISGLECAAVLSQPNGFYPNCSCKPHTHIKEKKCNSSCWLFISSLGREIFRSIFFFFGTMVFHCYGNV